MKKFKTISLDHFILPPLKLEKNISSVDNHVGKVCLDKEVS